MDSWGYRKEEDYFTDRYLVKSIDSYLARDANYLLNVGPTSTGIIPEKSASILRRIGNWHTSVAESFENVEPAPFLSTNKDILLTQRNRTVYVHVNKEPQGDRIRLEPINIQPESATLLNTGEPVECLVTRDPRDKVPRLRLRGLPVNQHPNTVLVVKLEFQQPLS
jgi:alpha-L-fucosidase